MQKLYATFGAVREYVGESVILEHVGQVGRNPVGG
jgi:hypothetical protein